MKRLSAPKSRQFGRMRLSGIAAAMRGRVRGRPVPSGGGGGGGGGSQAAFATSLNLPGINYFSGCYYFIDRIKQTSVQWTSPQAPTTLPANDARLDANHFPANLPAGGSATLLVLLGLDAQRSTVRFKAGAHKITWTPTGAGNASVTVSGGGISSVVAGTAGVTTFNCTSDTTDAFVTVTAPGGGAAGATNIKFFHTDHEAALLAGEIFDPDFIAYLASFPQLKDVRFLDWINGNQGTQTNAADWTPLTYQTWCRDANGVPPEVIGLLAKRLRTEFGRDITMWTVTPRFATAACMLEFFTRINAVDPTGTWKIKAGGGNEPWNSGFQIYAYYGLTYYSEKALTVVDQFGAASSAFNDRLACSFMHHAMTVTTQAEAVFGIGRVIRIATQQTDFVVFMRAAYKWRDTTNTLYGGITGKDWVNAGGQTEFTCYWYDYETISQKERLRADIGSFTNVQLRDIYIGSINGTLNNALLPHMAWLVAEGITAPRTMYEGACHSFYDKHNTIAGFPQSFAAVGNPGASTLDFPVETTNFFDDGDQLVAPNLTVVVGTTFPHYFYVRKTGTNSVRCYTSLAAYNGDSGNTGVGAAAINAGAFLIAPQTRFARWSDKMYSFNRSAEGLEVWQHAVNAYCRNASVNLNCFNIFVGLLAMRFGTDRFVNPFATHSNGQYDADTAIIDYMQGLNIP